MQLLSRIETMASTTSPESSGRPRGVGVAVASAIAGLILVAFGWVIPHQFKSLPVSVLAEAGRGGAGLATAIDDELDAGRPGVAAVFARAAVAVHLPDAAALSAKVEAFVAENPDLGVWGEANPYLTNALPQKDGASSAPGGVLGLFLPAAARESVNAFLAGSRNATVRALLATKELKSYRQFLPAFSAGGAPLEATILLTAMLVQSDELGGGAARELRALADEAVRTGDAARIEAVYLDFLALGRRYNWGQLVAMTREAGSLDTLTKLRHLHQVAPGSAPVIAASALLSKKPDLVVAYAEALGQHSGPALSFALYHGAASLDLLLRRQLPLDGSLELPPAPLPVGFRRSAMDSLAGFALRDPTLAVAVKIGVYLLGGFLLFIAGERLTALRRIELSPAFTTAARVVGAGVVCLLLVIVNEPYLALGSQPAGYELRLVIPVLGSNAVDSMNQSSNPIPIDTATLLSITFFFLLQALVYLICMLKLKEIESKPVHPLLKLRLAENEENLFDSGLYVGIAGTSAALVLQVLNVIEANLLAAYSSNLFGILCVAFVKIRHVRPFKQRLILQASETVPAAVEIPRVG